MEDVDLSHAKEHLEELIARANEGEEVRITDSKLGTVQITPVSARELAGEKTQPPQRLPGRWKGRFTVPERLFEPLKDDELAWLSGEKSK